MPVNIRQIGPCFAGEVEGIDMRRPLTPEEVGDIHAGMDKYAVLVFRNQHIDDEQQLAFTRSLGEIELAIGASLRLPNEYRLRRRLPMSRTSTRTTSRSPATIGAGCSRSATACGTPTARSRRPRPSTRCCMPGSFRQRAATPSSPTCAPPMTRSTRRPRQLCEDLVCEHSQIYSRQQIGFFDLTDEERERFKPVCRCWCAPIR